MKFYVFYVPSASLSHPPPLAFTCCVYKVKLSIFIYLLGFSSQTFLARPEMMKLCRVVFQRFTGSCGGGSWKSVKCTDKSWCVHHGKKENCFGLLTAVHLVCTVPCLVWKEEAEKFTKSFNCVCFRFFFVLCTLFRSPFISLQDILVLIYDFIFAHFSFYSFSDFPIFPFSQTARTGPCEHRKQSSTQDISWWWNINRSKEFNYINRLLFYDQNSVFIFPTFPISFFISNQFRDWKFVRKITFVGSGDWREPRARRGQGNGRTLTVKRFWFGAPFGGLPCSRYMRLLCNVKWGMGTMAGRLVKNFFSGWTNDGVVGCFMYVFYSISAVYTSANFINVRECVCRLVCCVCVQVCDFPSIVFTLRARK